MIMKLPTRNEGSLIEVKASINSEYVNDEKNDINMKVAPKILINNKSARKTPSLYTLSIIMKSILKITVCPI